MEQVVLRDHQVRVANDGNLLLGFTTVNGAWLDHLYVHPDHQGRGVGRILLREAKQMNPEGLSLHVFTCNDRARRLYEVAGFMLTAQSDGSRNEEREPDCTYTWSASARTSD